MAPTRSQAEIGPILREWRERRRLTQLELALDAGVSPRHLSFVETGRSKPGRDLLLRICEQLELPFRERNRLLLTVGHAPAFPERSLDDAELDPVRAALQLILTGHEPYPAIAVDRVWNIIASNAAVGALTTGVEVDPALLAPPVNAVRVSLHPRGLAPLIRNVGAWRAFFLDRLGRQLALTGDPELAALIEEVSAYAVPAPESDLRQAPGADGSIGPLRMSAPDGSELSFLGMFASFDMPFEVTTSELAVELLFPADRATAAALETLSARA